MNTKRQSKTRSQVRSFSYSWLPTFLWIIVVFYLSLTDSGLPDIKFRLILESDKIAHIIIYSVLTYLLMRSWKMVYPPIGRGYLFLIATVQAISFSIVMEVLQKVLTKTRHFDKQDIYANIAGTIVGALIYLLFQKIISRSSAEKRT
jgi:hypothetical protein